MHARPQVQGSTDIGNQSLCNSIRSLSGRVRSQWLLRHRIASHRDIPCQYCTVGQSLCTYLLCMERNREPNIADPFPCPVLLRNGHPQTWARVSSTTLLVTRLHRTPAYIINGYVCIACRASCRSVRLEAQHRDRLIFSVLVFFLFRYVSYTYIHTYATTDCTTPNFMRTLDRTAK